MAKFSIKLLPLVGVVLLLSAIGIFLANPEKEDVEKSGHDEIVPTADLSSKKFKVTLNDPDKATKWILDADKVGYSDEGDKDEIVLLEMFRVKFQQEHGLDFDLEAKNGVYNRPKGEIKLSGEIKGKTGNGYIFYTEDLLIQQDENCLKTDKSVTLVGPFFKVTGKGLFIDLEKETFKILKDVISIFDKESLTI